MCFRSRWPLAALAMLLSGLLAWTAAPAAAQAQRKSVNALTAAELMSFRRGVAQMMTWNSSPRNSANFRRSWIYWANMHSHFGADCEGPIVGGNMGRVQLWTAANANERQTWCECQHHNNQFLTWHRMYLLYFEQVLRQASGDANLRLPYWDYAADGRIPQAFRDQTYVNQNGQTVANPLYVPERKANLNNGSQALQPGVTSSANAMSATSEATFRTRLEATPHGSVHCTLPTGGCPNGLMGTTAPAALDPIFYMHHSNIDRLYECWLRVDQANRLPKAAAVLNERFSFVDGAGTVRQRQVRDMLTTSQLGYGYTQGQGCPAARGAPQVVVAQASPERSVTPAAGGGGTTLGRGTTEAPVVVEAPAASGAARGNAAAAARATVTIVDLQAHGSPGVMYNVYLANAAGRRAQIGVIDFFGFGGHAHGQTARTLDFDATDAVKALGLVPGNAPKLIFEPTTGATDSTVAAAVATMAPDAAVTYRTARLRFGG